ncbi:MAG: GGDEF domain-containing protein [Minisyncoccia bacterium]
MIYNMVSSAKSEIEKLKKELAVLRKIAIKDPLTGLYNRRGLLEEGEKFLKVMERLKSDRFSGGNTSFNLGVILIDLDDFKRINDFYGHKTGDEVLKKIAILLEESLRKSDIISRWGGDEFAILIFDINKNVLMGIAQRLQEKICNYNFRVKNRKIVLTISLGATLFSSVNLDLEREIEKADKAMYRAKKRGKNKFVIV